MSESGDLRELAERVRAAGRAVAALEPAVEAGRPWPLSEDFGTAPESHWGPPETLAHMAEMVPFWSGEIERILDADPGSGAVPFGRVVDNPLRIGILERDRNLPPRELFGRIDASVERLARRVEDLPPEAAQRIGVHPTVGEHNVAGIVARFVAGHLEDHVEQLRTALDAPG